MPNHITNYVRIGGSKAKIDFLVKNVKLIREPDEKLDDENEFDFNGIIEMPDELKHTKSPTDVFETQEEVDAANAKFSTSPLASTLQHETAAITKEEADRRMEKHNALNWYDWANNYWGTKWGAYDVHYLGGNDTEIAVVFNTAWSPPEEIFRMLEETDYSVDCFWQDEDPSNEGEWGEPYKYFAVDRPPIEVDYMDPADRWQPPTPEKQAEILKEVANGK